MSTEEESQPQPQQQNQQEEVLVDELDIQSKLQLNDELVDQSRDQSTLEQPKEQSEQQTKEQQPEDHLEEHPIQQPLESVEPVKKPKKKSVGFAPPPEEDLKEHHKIIKQKEEMRAKSSPFHKIPPEFSYLEKRDPKFDPKPIGGGGVVTPRSKQEIYLPPLSKLKFFDIKHLSVQNSETELQFHYGQINLPPSNDSIIVDIKYGGLNSIDVAKIYRYRLNLSNIKVGLGYEFVGVVTNIGKNYQSKFAEGDVVFGLLEVSSRRGALSSSQIIYPSRDVVIKIDQGHLDMLEEVNIDITNLELDKPFEVDDDDDDDEEEETSCETDNNNANSEVSETINVPVLAKLCSFPLLYNVAKQLLQPLKIKNNQANILINGGDTNIGLTIIQILLGVYNLDYLNLIVIVRESAQKHMEKLIDQLLQKFKDPATIKRVKCISFDLFNDDLYFAGEVIPINYKKKDFFASEVINAILVPHLQEKIDEKNINNYKLDLIVDLIGCKKFFQGTSTKIDTFDSINMPYKEHISSTATISKLFNGNVKEPFLKRILKPKSSGSCFVSGCDFYLEDPSYESHRFIESSSSSLWTNSWMTNYWSSYNYYDKVVWNLSWKKDLTEEGLQLVLDGKLKFKIDEFTDWKNYKRKDVKDKDAKIVLKVEDF